MHQPVKHQVRNRTRVPAILKLSKILREMLLAEVNVRTADAVLQHRPEAFNGVHGYTALGDILALWLQV